MRTVIHWNRLPRDVVEFLAEGLACLQTFKLNKKPAALFSTDLFSRQKNVVITFRFVSLIPDQHGRGSKLLSKTSISAEKFITSNVF